MDSVGRVFAAGCNASGQLGLGDRTDRSPRRRRKSFVCGKRGCNQVELLSKRAVHVFFFVTAPVLFCLFADNPRRRRFTQVPGFPAASPVPWLSSAVPPSPSASALHDPASLAACGQQATVVLTRRRQVIGDSQPHNLLSVCLPSHFYRSIFNPRHISAHSAAPLLFLFSGLRLWFNRPSTRPGNRPSRSGQCARELTRESRLPLAPAAQRGLGGRPSQPAAFSGGSRETPHRRRKHVPRFGPWGAPLGLGAARAMGGFGPTARLGFRDLGFEGPARRLGR